LSGATARREKEEELTNALSLGRREGSGATAVCLEADDLERVVAIQGCLRVEYAGGADERGFAVFGGDAAGVAQRFARFRWNRVAVDEQRSEAECHEWSFVLPRAGADEFCFRQFESGTVISSVNLLSFRKWVAILFFTLVMAKAVDCQCQAFQSAIEVLSRPWTAMILTALQSGAQRFGELAETAPGLGAKILSARLKDLEARGLIERHVEPGPPVRVAYELTKQGRAFGHVAEAIQRWGREISAHASR
jgi:DNA-binding HxlR family transcriptional regulator